MGAGLVLLEAAKSSALPSHVPVPTAHHGHTSPGSTARKLFSCDKGIKIAWTDGKHFAERSAEKKGNEAVKKIEHGAGRRRGGNIPFAAAGDLAEAARFFPCCTRVPQLGLKAGRAPRRASNPRQQGDREDFALHSAPAHLVPRACGSQAAPQPPQEMHLTQTHVRALLPSVTAPGLHCVFLTWLIRGADSLWRRTLIPFVGCFSWQPLFTQSGPPHSGKGIKTAESQSGTTGTEKQVLALTGIYRLFWWMNNIPAHIRPLKQTIFASFLNTDFLKVKMKTVRSVPPMNKSKLHSIASKRNGKDPPYSRGTLSYRNCITYGLLKNSRNTFKENPLSRGGCAS